MSLDTNFSAALKQRYPDWMIQMLVYKNRPGLAMLPKFEDAVGDVLKFPMVYADIQNTSADFATANAGVSGVQTSAFLVTRKAHYSLGSLSNETIEASKNNQGAFMQYLETSVNSALNALSNQVSMLAQRDGTGSVGAVTSAVGAGPTVVTLATAEDIVNFEVGMQVQAWPAGGAVRAAVGTITAVNRELGTFTTGADTSTWQAADLISVKGNKDAVLNGIQSWIPVGSGRTAALAASYYGVTRNIDTTRLGGVYIDKSASPIEEGMIDGLNLAHNIGDGLFDVALVNPMDFATIEKALGSKVQRVQISQEVREGGTVRGVVGFNALEVYYAAGAVKIVADRSIPKGYMHALQLDTWKLCSIGPVVRLFDGDGLKILRSYNSDSITFRVFSYSNLYCTGPGKNAVIKIA